MASACFLARCVSVPARLLANPTPLAITTCRLRRHGAAGARPVRAAGRMLGSVRYGTGAALGPKEAGAEVAAVPPSVPVRVAYELQLAGHRYLDVRTEGEFGGGHPAGAVNVPYMHSTGSGMAKNSCFLKQVSAIFRREDEIIIGCQSGRRSLMAAAELCSAGFTGVTDIAGGFSAWKENELPINQ
ncbi:thiosulfate sulfurtransferase 16, chloroplastic-like [Triticum urartu]|nr:thiosulfate sulfurtransferase 16, chloroplastic-like [Triticum urartu]